MDKKKYIKGIVIQIRCSNLKRKEISKQLLADIDDRISQGENFEDIAFEMGTEKEIADGFNESISEKEKKKYKINKICKIVIPIIILITAVVAIIQFYIPKSYDIEESKLFDKLQIENEVKNSIELIDSENYNTLQTNATEKMKNSLKASIFKTVKAGISENFGENKSFGQFYIVELVQGGVHYAVCEVTVTYEHTNVTYRITFNEDMKIAGLYMR